MFLDPGSANQSGSAMRNLKQHKPSPMRGWAAAILVMFAAGVYMPEAHAIPTSERQALIDIYASTNGESWTPAYDWGGAPGTECDWHAILCDATKEHVIGIYLQTRNLTGSLPPNLFNDLPHLMVFDASRNHLAGPIPTLVNANSLLHLRLASNRLTGTIPPLTSLVNVTVFRVDNNKLTGQVPSLASMTNLQLLYVSNNQLSGAMPPWPNPTWVYAGESELCGTNYFDSIPDDNWDIATGVTPWYSTCATGPGQIFGNGFD